MRIGELAKATGTKAETIRYYEREGILPAADRTDSNYRDYSDNHLAALTFVRRARQLGFSMARVRELLALSNHEDNPCQDVERLVQLQLTEVERKIADLMALRDELGQMLRSCQADKIGECQIIGSLGRQSVTLDLDDRPLMGDPEKRWNGRHWGAKLTLKAFHSRLLIEPIPFPNLRSHCATNCATNCATRFERKRGNGCFLRFLRGDRKLVGNPLSPTTSAFSLFFNDLVDHILSVM